LRENDRFLSQFRDFNPRQAAQIGISPAKNNPSAGPFRQVSVPLKPEKVADHGGNRNITP